MLIINNTVVKITTVSKGGKRKGMSGGHGSGPRGEEISGPAKYRV